VEVVKEEKGRLSSRETVIGERVLKRGLVGERRVEKRKKDKKGDLFLVG